MIQVIEYWPTFVDRDEKHRVVVVEDEADISLIHWLSEKIKRSGGTIEIKWNAYDKRFGITGFAMHHWEPCQPEWIVANLKHI